ncbi:Uncharacterized protein PRO82_001935 [Candidatus Protochlamydia amoebophila]|uniref:hypothetical protein n=1 Tax=Candidatus Protochlamydia amoebophila TaxID=362787 RepID=UPI001BC9D6BE|nr:hypothetical protein [Candidatus Protochlamydia amoebophila]MBS4164604.1 Uncharacterized protein [Candidatus Protochlamydia amoebophila]
MKESQSKSYDQFLHPYVFILKEGKKIQDDFLDYSLLLLQVNSADVIPSPKRAFKSSKPTTQLLKK